MARSKKILLKNINYHNNYPKHEDYFKQTTPLDNVISKHTNINSNIWLLQSHCNNDQIYPVIDKLKKFNYSEIRQKKYYGIQLFQYKKNISE